MISIKTERYYLLFGVTRSERYHNARRKFYDGLHTLSVTVALIFGSATIYTVFSKAGEMYTVAAAALVTLLSAIDLVVGTTVKARLHHDLAKRFIKLEKAINSVPKPTQQQLIEWTNIRRDIEADEPPIKRVLDSIIHNELLRAIDYEKKEEYVRIRWYQRLFAHIFDIQQHKIQKYKYLEAQKTV